MNLPDVQVPDLIVEERDLVIATHGRSFYVLDDIAPLRQISPEAETQAVHLFRPADPVRRIYPAHVDLYLDGTESVDSVEILDADGKRTLG